MIRILLVLMAAIPRMRSKVIEGQEQHLRRRVLQSYDDVSKTIIAIGEDDDNDDKSSKDDDAATSSSEATFVQGYVFVVLIAVVLFCGCACLSANGWGQVSTNEDFGNRHSTRTSIVLLRDSLIETGEPGWICWICGFENKPRANECVLCGADVAITQNYDQRQAAANAFPSSSRSHRTSIFSSATTQHIGTHSFFRHRGEEGGQQQASTYSAQEDDHDSVTSLGSFSSLNRTSSRRANVQSVTLGESKALDVTTRAQSFTIGRLNALTLRQKGAARRRLWKRISAENNEYRWVRRTVSHESHESLAFISILQLNENQNDDGKEEYDVNWMPVEDAGNHDPLLHRTTSQKNKNHYCCFLLHSCRWPRALSFSSTRNNTSNGNHEDLELIAALPFREKQIWFMRSFRREEYQHRRSVTIDVRRAHLLSDSMRKFEALSYQRLARSTLRVRFRGEIAVDAGGVAREWFQVVTKALFDDMSLFVSQKEAGYAYNINPFSGDIHSDHLRLFKFAGRFVAKALRDQVSLPITLCLPLLKHVLSVPLTFSDLEFIDAESFQSYAWIRDYHESDDANSTLEALGLVFAVDSKHPINNSIHTVELVPNGSNIAVTEENKSQYLSLVLKYRVLDAIRPQLISFLRGFDEILDRSRLAVFDYQELQLLIGGLTELSLDDWKRHTRYLGAFSQLKERHPVVQMFWQCIEHDFDHTDRARLCQFTTGSSQLPPMGFKALTGDDGRPCFFTLASLPRALGLWPRAHTCFNRLDLPLYKTYDELHSYLSLTIRLEIVGFTME